MPNYKIYQGDCITKLTTMQDNSVNFTLTDIPYDAVNRVSNGLRELDKGKADVLTFDLLTFLEQVYRVTSNSICIFVAKNSSVPFMISLLIRKGLYAQSFGKRQTQAL